MQAYRTAEEWAHLLGSRVLSPEEFDGIAVSHDTRGWGSVETTRLSTDPAQLDRLLADLSARGHIIAGVLPAQGNLPVRIVTREAPRSLRSNRRRRDRIQK